MTLLLDGALGTLLERQGFELPAPLWSTGAVERYPEAVTAIHQAYTRAGADILTAATFRASTTAAGERAASLAQKAIDLARAAASPHQRIAASLAPVFDCWHPEQSPADAYRRHTETAQILAHAKPDLILVETFASPKEALYATEAAVRTGLETWCALTAGFDGRLLSPQALANTAEHIVEAGASVVLVNCVPVARTMDWLVALASRVPRWGVYANDYEASQSAAPSSFGAARYASHAKAWLDLGADVIGGCCGTTPATIEALRVLLDTATPKPSAPVSR